MLPWQFYTWQLWKSGVSLTEQGFDPVPAALLDWLLAIDGLAHEMRGDSDAS